MFISMHLLVTTYQYVQIYMYYLQTMSGYKPSFTVEVSLSCYRRPWKYLLKRRTPSSPLEKNPEPEGTLPGVKFAIG